LFEQVTGAEVDEDPTIPLILSTSEEAGKVERGGGSKQFSVFRRIANPLRK
jgi:hypothetical protein